MGETQYLARIAPPPRGRKHAARPRTTPPAKNARPPGAASRASQFSNRLTAVVLARLTAAENYFYKISKLALV
jgi:hypothetical protein